MKQELIDALVAISGKDYVFHTAEDVEGYLLDETEELSAPSPARTVWWFVPAAMRRSPPF